MDKHLYLFVDNGDIYKTYMHSDVFDLSKEEFDKLINIIRNDLKYQEELWGVLNESSNNDQYIGN